MATEKLRIHEAANIFPMLKGEEREAFKDDLRVKGIIDPITVWKDAKDREWLLDGRNRWEIGQELRKEGATINGEPFPIPRTTFIGGEQEALSFVLSRNLQGRRHLTSGQRAACAMKANQLSAKYLGKEAPNGEATPSVGDMADIVAKMVGTNRTYIFKCLRLQTDAPHLLELVIQGELSIPQAIAAMKSAQEAGEGVATGEDGEVVEEEIAVKDGLDEIVPEEYLDTFTVVPQFKDAIAQLRGIKTDIEALAQSAGGAWLNEKELLAYVNNIMRSLNAAKPHAICPECLGDKKVKVEGKKRPVRCDRCEGAGYLNRSRYERNALLDAEDPDDEGDRQEHNGEEVAQVGEDGVPAEGMAETPTVE